MSETAFEGKDALLPLQLQDEILRIRCAK